MNRGALLFGGVTAIIGGVAVGRAAMSKAEIPTGTSPPVKEFMDKLVAGAAVIGGLAYFITQLPELLSEAEAIYGKVSR